MVRGKQKFKQFVHVRKLFIDWFLFYTIYHYPHCFFLTGEFENSQERSLPERNTCSTRKSIHQKKMYSNAFFVCSSLLFFFVFSFSHLLYKTINRQLKMIFFNNFRMFSWTKKKQEWKIMYKINSLYLEKVKINS
jgi:hypothetical protein